MPDIQPPKTLNEFPVSLVKNMIALATSGFGVVVALSWNEFIRGMVEHYIDPYLGRSGGLASLLIYAVVVTLLAVLVTMQLTSVQRKLAGTDDESEEKDSRKRRSARKTARAKKR